MRYLSVAFSGVLLACSGCVVHQPVPMAEALPPAQVAQNCREFQNTVTVGGTQQQAHGTTCQQPDGSWQIVSPQGTGAPPQAAAVVAAPVYPAYPYYPYPAYGYPAYYGPSVGIGFRFGGRFH